MSNDINKCPFCKNHDVSVLDELRQDIEESEFFVYCGVCRACGPKEVSIDNAILGWNRAIFPKGDKMERATELEYLRWFRINCDFGPAHEDVVRMLDADFREETGKELPEGWGSDE